MLHMEMATIGVCLWSIYLHRSLRRRDKDIAALMDAIGSIADGRAVLTRDNGKLIIKEVK